MQKMTNRLLLTEKQRKEILSIMEQTQIESVEMRKKHRKENYELQRVTVQKVSDVLNKEQKVEFRKALTDHYTEQKKIRETKYPKPAPPPPPPPPRKDRASEKNP